MNKTDNLDSLIHIDAYVDFLQGIYAIRESLIQQMHDVPSDRIQPSVRIHLIRQQVLYHYQLYYQ